MGRMPPALVLLHGFTHTGASWGPVTAALEERYRALAPDLRGHGGASELEPVELAAVIDDVLAVGEAPRFTLAGYSMGGRIALHVALRAPERVQRLLLIGASPGIEDDGERAVRRRDDERLAAQLEQMTIEEFATQWADTPVLRGQSPQVARAAHEDRLRSTPSGLARALRGLGPGALPPLWGRLGELPMPVTLVVGERDEKFRAIAEEMAPRFGGEARVVVVPGTGHAVHLEAPAAVARAITATARGARR